MKTTNNTVLITGGSAGIGFEIAKILSEKGNHVIITGRDRSRLEAAAASLQNVTAIAGDVSDEEQVAGLVARIKRDFPQLNVLINNAGFAAYYDLAAGGSAFANAREEMLVNYLSVVNLNEQLIPLLAGNEEAAIVNVSSIVAFVPGSTLPTYAASKAALHSYTQSLRYSLAKTTGIKVFELMPPLVNTAFSAAIGGERGIPPELVAQALESALEKDEFEIHVAGTADLRQLFFKDPQAAFEVMNPR